MIAILIALILSLAPASQGEAPAQLPSVAVEVAQTPQEQALEASAWESLDLAGIPAGTFTEETIVTYSHTVTVEDGDYSVGLYQFEVVDAYDDVYIHIFTVDTLYHA